MQLQDFPKLIIQLRPAGQMVVEQPPRPLLLT